MTCLWLEGNCQDKKGVFVKDANSRIKKGLSAAREIKAIAYDRRTEQEK